MTTRQFIKGFFISLIVITFILAVSWIKFLYSPISTNNEAYTYTVPAGTSIKTVINDLYFKNIIKNRFYLEMLVRLRGDGNALKAGEYYFPKGTTPLKMLNQLMTGRGLVFHSFTIIPGWTFKELRHAILLNSNLRHVLPNYSDDELMTYLESSLTNPEGQFFPDTYYFADGIQDIVLLKQAFKAMQAKLHTAWEKRISELPYKNENEVLIAASLIEKEAYFNEERPVIAAVLVNRLQKDMLLQIDPTVIYGMGDKYDGNIRKEDLLENTPYNTYVHKGLPPAPIAMPSLESIMAVVQPAKNDFLYYVAKGDGSHQFSSTYIEHQTAISELNKSMDFFNSDQLRNHLKKMLHPSEFKISSHG